MNSLEIKYLTDIAVALAIGLLIGSERGWHSREQEEGSRVAGIRTFTLISVLGGISAVFSQHLLPGYSLLICALVFFCIALLLTVGYLQSAKTRTDLSITTEVAAMLTFWLGTLPAYGFALLATTLAVILALLLHLKYRLHHWLRILDERELLGTLQFLIVSVVLLPLLPNRGFGPWEAINPYQLWWMVVLISGLSLVGYFAMRMAGARRGILATSLTGGLVSSTSVTITLSRLHGDVPDTGGITAGILLACATMFARIIIVISAIKASLLTGIFFPMGTGFLSLLLIALWQFRTSIKDQQQHTVKIHNPFQLGPAIKFGALLGGVMVAAQALRHWLGDTGLYLLSVATGIADVDAIVLSLAPNVGADLTQNIAVTCISLAAATNTLIKGIYCRVISGPVLGNKVLISAIVSSLLVLSSLGIVRVVTE